MRLLLGFYFCFDGFEARRRAEEFAGGISEATGGCGINTDGRPFSALIEISQAGTAKMLLIRPAPANFLGRG